MKLEKEKIAELVFLFLVVGALLWTGIAGIWGHKIEHPYPWGYMATDAFQHQTRAEWIKDAGNYEYEGYYYSSNYKDIIGFYPPILNHAAVLLSHLSGLQVYDTMQILIFLAAVFGALTVYLIAREYNKKIAILSMPLVVFLFAIQGTKLAWLWGHWPSLIGNFFLIAFCWSILRYDLKKSWLLIGLFIAGTAMAHTVFTIFAILFVIAFFVYKYFNKDLKKHDFRIIFAAGLLAIAISGYFLNIFRQTWLKVQPYKFAVASLDKFAENVRLLDFSYALILIIAGLVLAVFMLRKQSGKIALFGIFMFLMGLTNYVGFDRRALNLRFFWPITLSVLFGIAVYYVINKLRKDVKTEHLIGASIVIGGLLIASLSGKYLLAETPGIMNEYLWDTMGWVKENTHGEAFVFYVYGDLYDQFAFIANSKRNAIRMNTQDYIDSLQKNTIKRVYKAWLYSEYGAGLPYSDGFLSYKLRTNEVAKLSEDSDMDICSADYVVIDKVSRVPEVSQYNLALAQIMLNHTQMQLVHQNDMSAIIKNNRPGADCIA